MFATMPTQLTGQGLLQWISDVQAAGTATALLRSGA
jgi:hypothetical protein